MGVHATTVREAAPHLAERQNTAFCSEKLLASKRYPSSHVTHAVELLLVCRRSRCATALALHLHFRLLGLHHVGEFNAFSCACRDDQVARGHAMLGLVVGRQRGGDLLGRITLPGLELIQHGINGREVDVDLEIGWAMLLPTTPPADDGQYLPAAGARTEKMQEVDYSLNEKAPMGRQAASKLFSRHHRFQPNRAHQLIEICC